MALAILYCNRCWVVGLRTLIRYIDYSNSTTEIQINDLFHTVESYWLHDDLQPATYNRVSGEGGFSASAAAGTAVILATDLI